MIVEIEPVFFKAVFNLNFTNKVEERPFILVRETKTLFILKGYKWGRDAEYRVNKKSLIDNSGGSWDLVSFKESSQEEAEKLLLNMKQRVRFDKLVKSISDTDFKKLPQEKLILIKDIIEKEGV